MLRAKKKKNVCYIECKLSLVFEDNSLTRTETVLQLIAAYQIFFFLGWGGGRKGLFVVLKNRLSK